MGMKKGIALLAGLVLAAGCTPAATNPAPAGSATTAMLENTDWRLVEVGGRPALGATNAPTLRLDPAEHRAGGNTGCNHFGGGYELSGQSLRFSELVSTRRACTDPAMNEQEAAYVRALDETRTWRVDGNTLVLSGASGVVARFATP